MGDKNRKRGSEEWIPFANYCITGQFMRLKGGFKRHCGPTAAVNLICTLQNRLASKPSATKNAVWKEEHRDERSTGSGRKNPGDQSSCSRTQDRAETLFLVCAGIGERMKVYWNRDILKYFGGTFNLLTGPYLRRCLREAGLGDRTSVHFYPWITAAGVRKALEDGAIVYLQVYRHRKYKNHHMLCYACRRDPASGKLQFLLADGWNPGPVWTEEENLGHGHYLTVRLTGEVPGIFS